MEASGQLHCLATLLLRATGIHSVGGWVGPRTSMVIVHGIMKRYGMLVVFFYQPLKSKENFCVRRDGCTWSAIECALLQQNVFIYLGLMFEIMFFNYFQFLDLEGT
jgi:hypothetical protein